MAFLALWLALRDALDGQRPHLVLLAAPLIASWFGGWGPGVLATLLCAIMGQKVLEAPGQAGGWPEGMGEWVSVLVFLTYALIFSGFHEHRLRRLRIAFARQENLLRAHEDLALRERRMREAIGQKDAFISAWADALRHPLAPVRRAVDSMRRLDPADPRLARAREVIARQVGHFTRLIDDLPNVSRIRQAGRARHNGPCDLARIAHDTMEDYRAGLESNGPRLLLDLPDTPVWVDGDEVNVAQMLGNLLNNGARVSKAGGLVTVEVRADPETRRALLRVTDTRIGLGANFSLWLATAGPGAGAPQPGPDECPVDMPVPARTTARHGQQGLRILLVADHPDGAEALAEALALGGHALKVCHDGEAGLAAAKEDSPDVLISDLGLPGDVDGYQLARRLRADPQQAGLLLIALSGYADRRARARSQSAGFDAHLPKPPDLQQLLDLLAQFQRKHVDEAVA